MASHGFVVLGVLVSLALCVTLESAASISGIPLALVVSKKPFCNPFFLSLSLHILRLIHFHRFSSPRLGAGLIGSLERITHATHCVKGVYSLKSLRQDFKHNYTHFKVKEQQENTKYVVW